MPSVSVRMCVCVYACVNVFHLSECISVPRCDRNLADDDRRGVGPVSSRGRYSGRHAFALRQHRHYVYHIHVY